MEIQRARNLTTGRLHTGIDCVYQDIEYLTGAHGIMTHMLPRAMRALEPRLREVITDPRFWDGEFDTTHAGEIEIAPLEGDELAAFWKRYEAQPDPFEGKTVVTIEA